MNPTKPFAMFLAGLMMIGCVTEEDPSVDVENAPMTDDELDDLGDQESYEDVFALVAPPTNKQNREKCYAACNAEYSYNWLTCTPFWIATPFAGPRSRCSALHDCWSNCDAGNPAAKD